MLLKVGIISLLVSLLVLLIIETTFEYFEKVEREASTRLINQKITHLIASKDGLNKLKVLEDFGFFSIYPDEEDLPDALQPYQQPGSYALGSEAVLLVHRNPITNRLNHFLVRYEIGSGETLPDDDDSENYLLIIIFTLLVPALVMAIANRFYHPVAELSRRVKSIRPDAPGLEPLEGDDEVGSLSRLIADQLKQIKASQQREKEFTRFASHELRTPTTILRGSLDLLQEQSIEDPVQQRAIARMDKATHRMELLIDTFLLLGREKTELPVQNFTTREMQQLITDLTDMHGDHHRARITLALDNAQWQLPGKLFGVMLDNLISNALLHGTGQVNVHMQASALTVQNEVSEHSEAGSGMGLLIIERICEYCGWKLQVKRRQKQFIAVVSFTRIVRI